MSTFHFGNNLLPLLYGKRPGIKVGGLEGYCDLSLFGHINSYKQMKGTYSWYLLGNAIMIVATLLIDMIL